MEGVHYRDFVDSRMSQKPQLGYMGSATYPGRREKKTEKRNEKSENIENIENIEKSENMTVDKSGAAFVYVNMRW
jgi:hypothetical protein